MLRHEWFRYQCDVLDIEGPVEFSQLAEWVELQAKILRRETINVAGPVPPTSSGSKTKVSNEGSGGEKESVSPSQDVYLHPNARRSEQTQQSPSRDYLRKVPAGDPSLCVICKHVNLEGLVDYRTIDCFSLKAPVHQGNVEVDKRWEILEAKNVCLSCMNENHRGKECPTPTDICDTCKIRHFKDRPCRRRADVSGKNNSRRNVRGNVHPNYSSMNTDRRPCYSRTCPVQISHPSSREKMVGLAIIDDQAGKTYVDPLVDQVLRLPRQVKRTTSHGTITIEGESRIRPCHVISGLVVAPLDGQKEIALPEVIMQNEIPDSYTGTPKRFVGNVGTRSCALY